MKCVSQVGKTKARSFKDQIEKDGFFPLKARGIKIFQINVGKLCNLSCSHCHVEAGPDKLRENMSADTFEQCLKIIEETAVTTVDLTGGAPEMNPHLEGFIAALATLNKRIIVRSNLTVLSVPKYAPFLDIFAENGVEVVASLPCYLESNTDEQRGSQVFKKSIAILQELNRRGYGQEDSSLTINLVHNPVGTHLPPDQVSLEETYKAILWREYAIRFNSLFCITNMPISRYLDMLIQTQSYDAYMETLVNAYNPRAVENVMCRETISISWDGKLYDCDFNQMLGLSLGKQLPQHVSQFDFDVLNQREIVIRDHCYGCTAGAGSSCQGSLS